MTLDFRRTFHPTEDEKEADRKIQEKIREELFSKRSKITLKHYINVLFISEPFTGFIGDCRYCTNYIESPAFVEGGSCGKHNMPCGSGLICKDNDSNEINDWKEFKKIIEKERA